MIDVFTSWAALCLPYELGRVIALCEKTATLSRFFFLLFAGLESSVCYLQLEG